MKRADLIFTALKIPTDFAMIVIAGIAAYFLRVSPFVSQIRPVLFEVNLPFERYVVLVFFVAVFWLFIFALAGLYRLSRRSFLEEFFSILVASSLGVLSVILYLFLTLARFDSRFIILSAWPLTIVFVILGRVILAILKGFCVAYFHMGVHRVLVVGDDPLAKTIVSAISEDPSLGYRVIKHISHLGLDPIKEIVKDSQIDEIVLSSFNWPKADIIQLIYFCEDSHLTFKFAPDIFQTLTAHTRIESIEGIPLVELKRTSLEGWGKVMKRAIDVAGALLGFVLFSPLMALIAFLVKLDSPGPMIYKNVRVGPRGEEFITYKFRTMKQEYCTGPFYENHEEASRLEDRLIQEKNVRRGPVFKILEDPRRTTFGKMLEKTSFDELPQFFNVLIGNMSLVGPRPHMPKEVAKYDRQHRKVFGVKPGITGLAQISGRSDLDFDTEVELDTYYIENWSLWLDLIILLKTPFAVLLKHHRSQL